MEIQYHTGALPEASITASSVEFAALADRVAELVAAGAGAVVFPASVRGLSALVVRIGSGPVAVSGSVLSVNGGSEAVGLFGLNMPIESSLPADYHVHFEHVGREWFVAAESMPLVMIVDSISHAEPNTASDCGA